MIPERGLCIGVGKQGVRVHHKNVKQLIRIRWGVCALRDVFWKSHMIEWNQIVMLGVTGVMV